jgi:rhodanese-related sulfurtransferase
MTLHQAFVVAALTLGGGAAVADGVQPAGTSRLAREIERGDDQVSAVRLAEAIMAGRGPRVFDLRSAADFRAFHIPSATHATLDEMTALDLPRATPIVVYADSGGRAAQAWTLLRRRGYRDVAFLRGGAYEWLVRVHEPQLPIDATAAERTEFERRAALSRYFGGQPHMDVPRADVAAGSWTTAAEPPPHASMNTSLLVAAIRRRGC